MNRKAIALALALLHAFTLTADAATYYVNMTTGNNSWDGTSATYTGGTTGPWETIAKANSVATTGDLVVIAGNDTIYDTSIVPAVQGTSWLGDTTGANYPRIPGISSNYRDALFRGLRVTGGVTLGSRYQHIRKSQIVGDFYTTYGGIRVDNCRIGGKPGQSSTIAVYPSGGEGDSMVFYGNSMNLRVGGTGVINAKLINWIPADSIHQTMDDWIIQNNACTLTIQPGQVFEKVTMWNHMKRARFSGNTWFWMDSCGIAYGTQGYNGTQALLVRDSMKLCTWTNDHFEFYSPDGNGLCQALIYSSGARRPDSANTWKFCTFKSNIRVGGDGGSFYQQWEHAPRDSFYRNTVVCSTSSDCYRIAGARLDTTFFYRNTFVNLGSGRPVTIDGGCFDSQWGTGKVRFTGNLIYGRHGTGQLRIVQPNTSGNLVSNYNTIFAPLAGSQNALRHNACSQVVMSHSVPTGAGVPYENNSTWGSPRFVDSTYFTFDANILSDSYARGAGPSSVDCGAKDYTPAPPSTVTLEGISIGPDLVQLSWIAPGANGTTGTATSYTIKYSTSYAVAAAGGGTVASAPTPSAYGTPESQTITGLTASTTYYFTIYATNGTGGNGDLSNVLEMRTWPSGGVEP